MYYQGLGVKKDYQEAIRWYKVASVQGNAHAQCSLGNIYLNGEGVLQDFGEAAYWYRMAAEQGNSQAQGYLGYFYDHGLGIPQDLTEAAKWYRLAADQGDAVIQFNLGLMYSKGWACRRTTKRLQMVPEGGRAGVTTRPCTTCLLYSKGNGVPWTTCRPTCVSSSRLQQGHSSTRPCISTSWQTSHPVHRSRRGEGDGKGLERNLQGPAN
jgi:hypothetical protein